MDENSISLLGLAITATLGWGTMLAGLGWRLLAAIKRVEEDVSKKHTDTMGAISDVKKEYVRRDDLEGQLARMSTDVRELRKEIQESNGTTNARLDALLVAIAKQGPSGN